MNNFFSVSFRMSGKYNLILIKNIFPIPGTYQINLIVASKIKLCWWGTYYNYKPIKIDNGINKFTITIHNSQETHFDVGIYAINLQNSLQFEIFGLTVIKTETFPEIITNSTEIKESGDSISPKITVIFPTINRLKKFSNIISNFINQQFKDFEMIVVEDGSDQFIYYAKKKIIQQLNDGRFKIIKNKTSIGFGASLNRGISMASGEYITWILDNNDYYPNYLYILYEPSYDFIYTFWDKIESEINLRNIIKSVYHIETFLNRFNYLGASMWKKIFIDKIGYYIENINEIDNYEYLIRTFTNTDNICIKNISSMKCIINGKNLYNLKKPQIIFKKMIGEIYQGFNLMKNKDKTFIYFSKNSYQCLFQRSQQIIRFIDTKYLKIFITLENMVYYDEKYQVLTMPYRFKDLIIPFCKNKKNHIYYTDYMLYDSIMDFKIKINAKKIIYDLIVAPIGDFHVWNNQLQNVVNNADIVLYSHPELVYFLHQIDNSKEYYYISNGCDYKLFKIASTKIYPKPADIPIVKKPILGYYGAISEYLDYDIIKKYANDGEYHILMIGGIPKKDHNKLLFHKNITWLNYKPYDKIPIYLSWFDVCFLPFKECLITKYANPCKLWEYMATGKKIIKYNVTINVNQVIDIATEVEKLLLIMEKQNKTTKSSDIVASNIEDNTLSVASTAIIEKEIDGIDGTDCDTLSIDGTDCDTLSMSGTNCDTLSMSGTNDDNEENLTFAVKNIILPNDPKKILNIYLDNIMDNKYDCLVKSINNLDNINHQAIFGLVKNQYENITHQKFDFENFQKNIIVPGENIYQCNFNILARYNNQKKKMVKLVKPVIIFFPIIDYYFRIQRNQHICRILAERGYTVFYVRTTFNDDFEENKINDNLYEIHLSIKKIRNVSIYNTKLIDEEIDSIIYSINKLKSKYRFNFFISLVTNPFWYQVIQNINNTAIIYDCLDYHAGFETVNNVILENERLILDKCDKLVITSPILAQMIKKDVYHLIRNACDFDYFNSIKKTDDTMIIGYYGVISDWFDPDLVEKIALEFPQCQIHLIGNVWAASKNHENKIKILKKYSNIKFFGEITYDELHLYLKKFSVGIIPFLDCDLIKCTDLVKMYEMLSFGLPVVSTKICDLDTLQIDHLYYKSISYDQFIQNIKMALSETNNTIKFARIEYARQNIWENRIDQMEKIIKEITPQISVVILCWNHWPETYNCIQSILSNSSYENYEIIVVNNASTDETSNELDKLTNERIKVVHNVENYGFAKGMNIGSMRAGGDYIVLLNNDTIVATDWLYPLVKPLIKNNHYGFGSPVTNNCGNAAKQFIWYDSPQDLLIKISKLQKYKNYSLVETHNVPFFGAIVRKKDFYAIGMLDVNYGRGGWEDDDIQEKMRNYGKNANYYTYGSFVYHIESLSMGSTAYYHNHPNQTRFEKKWMKKWIPPKYQMNQITIKQSVNSTYLASLISRTAYLTCYVGKNNYDICISTEKDYTMKTLVLKSENNDCIIFSYQSKTYVLKKDDQFNNLKFYSLLNSIIQNIE